MATKLNTDRKAVKRHIEGNRIRYNCPKCGSILHIRNKYKKNLCMECGQYLDWERPETEWYTDVRTVYGREQAEEYLAAYKRYSGFDWIESEIYADGNNPANRRWPKELMFIFTEKKGYGRFMRWIGKEGE